MYRWPDIRAEVTHRSSLGKDRANNWARFRANNGVTLHDYGKCDKLSAVNTKPTTPTLPGRASVNLADVPAIGPRS